jgi:two-component system NtrC family sensor kinase
MRLAILAALLMSCHSIVFAQKHMQQQVTQQIDSVLAVIANEPDEDQLVELMLSLYQMRMQSFPIIYQETGQKLNRMALASGNSLMEAKSWTLLGQAYRLSGNYVKGLEFHQKAIALAEHSQHELLIGIAYNELGHIYKDREENEKALKIYQTSLQHLLKSKKPLYRRWPEMNIGAIYLAMQQPDSAIHYTSLVLSESIPQSIGITSAYLYHNMAGAFSLKGENSNALKYFHLGLQGAIQDSSSRYLNTIYLGLAEHYLRNDQVDSSIFFARKAVIAVENTPFTFLSIKPARLLTSLFEPISADSALKYMRIYRIANDSLFSSRTNQQLQMMEFEEEQRKFALTLEAREYRNKIRMYFLLGALALFLILAITLLRNNRLKQKVNGQLHKQKEELQLALSQLKSTQAQLIQSEKMASLGELTAGIAHEIQNPLNFVNNFSEVNAELIDELQHELTSGSVESARELGIQIKQNEEKINFHGKRADGIVKSMLQHSRTSSGKKEQVDINELVDEYLRLAYHGCRARDKSFNATMNTSFDNSLESITAVPQDIGRVLLNLMTNAFYAVAEKSRSATAPYQSQVSVSTKKNDNEAMITIEDNGTGISNTTLEKIFQPFFTTKPTGEGTGLGLSISYDIIKAHGGDIRASSVEGQGTTFIITLPINPQ